MDINSASYDPSAEINDGFCTYRYLKTVSVTSMPDILTLEDYETDDVCCWMPDLQFKLVMNRDPELEYYDLVTGIVYEVEDLPVTWDAEITDRYLLTEMEYYYELVKNSLCLGRLFRQMHTGTVKLYCQTVQAVLR